MATETSVDYAAVLADLEARRAQLDGAIATIRAILGQAGGSMLSPGTPVAASMLTGGMSPDEIPDGAFFNMSIAEAARQYLRMVRRKQSTRQIADAIRKGGIESTAKQFTTTVYSILERQDDFTRVGTDWALIEWYPGMKKKGKKGAAPNGKVETDATEPKGPPGDVSDL